MACRDDVIVRIVSLANMVMPFRKILWEIKLVTLLKAQHVLHVLQDSILHHQASLLVLHVMQEHILQQAHLLVLLVL